MYLPFKTSKRRIKEAENARNNRWEIIKALSHGQINRRDLFKWGLFTSAGLLLCKNGLSPFAKSAFAQVPIGIPRSPVGNAQPFTQPLNRLDFVPPTPLTKLVQPTGEWEAVWPDGMATAKRLSWHTDFSSHPVGNKPANPFINPITKRGPMEGRPPGEWFGHQRWKEFFPQVGYALTFGECASGTKFHPDWPDQEANRMWPMYHFEGFGTRGQFPIPLLKGRYGEPIIMRAYNNLPVDRTNNGGFGRNEPSTHFHNAHNGAESDGASNAFHFPGTFYDYHWGTTLARHDTINRDATDRRASGPDGHGGLVQVPGDWRELQGTLWFHDHRFFFTAENVYKGMAAMMNYYSGPDRGNETLNDGVNLRLPSGSLLDWGNIDFDVNLFVSDLGTDLDQQCRFDIFTTEGFVGDLLTVNQSWQPYMEVLPRKYRFRLINGSMSRFIQLALADQDGRLVPFQFIANDGNFVVRPITLTRLDEQGTAERYDIVVDFSRFRIGDKITLVNLLKQISGNKPDGALSVAQALAQFQSADPLVDPAVGPVMQFRIVSEVESVDVPGHIHRASDPDPSRVPSTLTEQIPIVAPVRERHVEFGRNGTGDSRDPRTGECNPDCPEGMSFPWTVKVNGEKPHSMNANRISLLIPKPGEVEHWTYQNSGGGWDHPIHLHFEEGVTMNRGNQSIPATENLVRKDVWRLRPAGSVKFQVRFGEYGGAYVNHCHNTVHEDFALLMRYQILTDKDNPKSSNLHVDIIPTPIPSPDGVTYMTPEVLAEGNPLGNGVTVSAAPVITSTAVLTGIVGQTYSYNVDATDANGDSLTYSLATAPFGMAINSVTGLITWIPTAGQAGSNDVTVRVADPKALTATQSFTVTVTQGTQANVAPVIISIPVLTATVGQAYGYDVNATDVNGGNLIYSLVAPIPVGMTINQASGQIAWIPAAGQVGPNAVTVRVTDPGGLFASQSFTVTVSASAPAPTAPVITSTPVLAATVGVAYSYPVVATDVNGGNLTYSLTTFPAGMTINATTHVISWTPAAGQVGPNGVTVRVQDQGGLFATQSFTVTVAAAPTGPTVTGFILRNATTDTLIGPLTNGTIVSRAACSNCQFNIEALVSGTGFNNIRLVLSGATAHANNEGSFPYTKPGDGGVGVYNGMVLNQGAHSITATPRTSTGATIGTPLTVNFTVGP